MGVVQNPFGVSHKGIRKPELITFAHSGLVAADVGSPMKITGEMTVGKSADGEEFVGTLHEVADADFCTVRLGGVFECPYSGAAPAYGHELIAADGAGKVKVAAGGQTVIVLSKDTTAGVVRFILP